MRRKLLHFLANNVFGLLALFVALGGTAYAVNTVRSTDIVDGEVKSVDIGNGEILSADVKDQSLTTFDVSTFLGADVVDNTLTGDDVDESTLGRVPDAARVGGVDAAELRPGTAMGVQRTDSCYVTGQYGLCGTISITVPANTYYKVDVHSSMTAFGSTAGQGAVLRRLSNLVYRTRVSQQQPVGLHARPRPVHERLEQRYRLLRPGNVHVRHGRAVRRRPCAEHQHRLHDHDNPLAPLLRRIHSAGRGVER